jgi:hypothetical protein
MCLPSKNVARLFLLRRPTCSEEILPVSALSNCMVSSSCILDTLVSCIEAFPLSIMNSSSNCSSPLLVLSVVGSDSSGKRADVAAQLSIRGWAPNLLYFG